MARDPIDRNLLRLEGRRFTTKCEAQVASIRRADTMREVARMSSMPVPPSLYEEYTARDAAREVLTAAEDRVRELVHEQIQGWLRAEPIAQDKIKKSLLDSWANLTGSVGHLRPWALAKLAAAEQSRPKD
jgi:ADP-dependent phosphofructokinase/glucokinase